MFMGAGPELHGYTEWGSKTPELPSRELNQHGIFPTIFKYCGMLLRKQRLVACTNGMALNIW